MLPPELGHIVLWIIIGLSILLLLIRPFNVPEVYWVGSGALLLVILRLTPLKLAGKAISEGSDVYLFLIGMMLLSELAKVHGVFDWVAAVAVRGAGGSSARLFGLVYGIGIVTTSFMSNDATAVVLTPAIITAVRKAKVEPLPHIFACAMIANAASFVLPISNPANLVVFREGMPPLGHWLLSFAVPSILSIAMTFVVLRVFFRNDLQQPVETHKEDEKTVELTVEGRMILCGLIFVVVVLLSASAFNRDLGLPTCLAALVVTAVVSVQARANPIGLAREISWGTLALVGALFIMVDTAESVGALQFTTGLLKGLEQYGSAAATYVTGSVVAVANNIVNNLPLGLIAGATIHAAHIKGLLANAILIGVDLGPNLSITGSLATILWLLALRKCDIDVSFWKFLKVGAIAMPAALVLSLGGVIAMKALIK